MPVEGVGLVDRTEIVRHLNEDFGQRRFGDRMFQYAVRALGLKPTGTVKLESPQKGRVGLYDAVVTWLIFSVNSRCKGQLEAMENELEPYRALWDRLHATWPARQIPGFDEDREYGAELLMLTSRQYGLPVREVFERVRNKPELLRLTRFDSEYLENVFIGLKIASIASLEALDLHKRPSDPSPEQAAEQFAADWLRETANLFAGQAPEREHPSE